MSVIRVSRCGVTRGTLSGKHVLTLIWKTMTGGLFKIVLNWAVLTFTAMWNLPSPSVVAFATSRSAPSSVHNSCTTARKEEREGDRGEGRRKRGEEMGEWIRRERSEVVGQ